MSPTKSVRPARGTARAVILRHAIALFAEHGYGATSTKAIAEAAGVSEGSVFYHFPTKLDLLRAVAGQRDGETVLASRALAVLERGCQLSAAEMVPTLLQQFAEMLAPDRVETRLFRVIVGESASTPELRELFEEHAQKTQAALTSYLGTRRGAGELRDDLVVETAAANLIAPMFWFLITHSQLDVDDWRVEASIFARRTADQWLHGAVQPKEKLE